jgi:hypothetical protein
MILPDPETAGGALTRRNDKVYLVFFPNGIEELFDTEHSSLPDDFTHEENFDIQ